MFTDIKEYISIVLQNIEKDFTRRVLILKWDSQSTSNTKWHDIGDTPKRQNGYIRLMVLRQLKVATT